MGDWVQDQMARVRQGQAQKGGPGSGHFGHAGRPGQVGGSAPGTGSGGQADAAGRLETVRQAMNYNDPETGLRIEENFWTEADVDEPDVWFYDGTIRTDDGEIVGDVTRYVSLEQEKVHHVSFRLNKEWQGQGFGSRYYRNLEQAYIAAGIKTIYLHANDKVGGYAWARMGFDFREESERAEMAATIATAFWEHGGPGSGMDYDGVLRTIKDLPAWEMAALTAPDGTRVGRSAMLGSGWKAVKQLAGDSPGRIAGGIYYEEKDKNG